jgi:hypothetical protein
MLSWMQATAISAGIDGRRRGGCYCAAFLKNLRSKSQGQPDALYPYTVMPHPYTVMPRNAVKLAQTA